jgi:hypothetical protein
LRLLLRDHLDAAPALRSSEAPKLFLAHAPGQVQVVTPVSTVRTAGIASDNSQMETTSRMYALAAAPKRFANPADDSDVRRFLAGGS